jgi:ribosomal RNA-processing protein 12
MADSDEEDSDDGRTLATGMTRMSRMSRISSGKTLKRGHMETASFAQSTKSGRNKSTTMRIKNDVDGNVTDVKDLKAVRFSESPSDESDFEEDMEFDSSGKLVVHDMEELDSTNKKDDGDTIFSFKSKRSTTSERSALTRDTRDSTKKKKKALNNGARLGSAYKAKKAGGDTKKKGQKFEPYAYMQLDGRNYSKKNRRQAVEQMSSVVHQGNKRLKRS